MNKSVFSAEEELLLQGSINAVFLSSICISAKDFLESDYFKNLQFPFEKVKGMYENKNIAVGNLGMLASCLYLLLVLPKEKLVSRYPQEYNKVNSWIENNSLEIVDTYNYEDNADKSLKLIRHIRHIRNAVSHGNIELGQEKDCIFMDSMVCKGKLVTYKLRMKLTNIGELMGKLIEVQQPFVADMIKKQNSSI